MSPDLTKKLLDDFPKLFRSQHETSMQRGFECGDGWFELIYKLSQEVEVVARDSGLKIDSPQWPLCRQVKAKMGSLRFIVFRAEEHVVMYERVRELIHAAMDQSLNVNE